MVKNNNIVQTDKQAPGECQYRPGLEGVVATRSNISYVDGEQGLLEYRGIAVRELVEHSTFEETDRKSVV